MKEAKFYEKLENKKVQCKLCARNCIILDRKRGSCRVRENIKGKLYSLVYGKAVSVSIDPIEKKPLFNFMPGTSILSLCTVGCNLHCKFCQNDDISQPIDIIGEETSPKEIVDSAIKYKTPSIAYTYTEPTIFYEYAYDIMKLASKKNIKNVFVTNGFINKEPLEEIAPYLNAANVDLKAFSDEFYRKLSLIHSYKPVLKTIKRMHNLGIHVEITNLLIPTWNDNPKQIRKLVKWVYNLDKNIPLHFSIFHPCYKLEDVPPTPLETLERAYKIAKKIGMNYVYLGNVSDTEKTNTYCPKCKEILIIRHGNQLIDNRLKKNKCFKCNETIPIVP